MVNATARSNGAKSVSNTMDVWKEKYRLTMSNLLAAAIQSGNLTNVTASSSESLDKVTYDDIDKFVRKILDAKYDGDEAPF